MNENSALNGEKGDQERRHELRKQLKLLRLFNMKMKKQLRMASRVRFLNRMRLEGEVTQLNCVVSTLRKAVLGRNDPTPDPTQKDFSNPKSSIFNSSIKGSNINEINKPNGHKITDSKPLSESKRITAQFKFFCDKCDFRCKKKTPFDIHLRRHSGERPFGCDVCGKTFVAKYELKLHSAKHTNGNKYSCDECDYTTYRPDILVKHRENHFGLKTHTCDLCPFKTDERSKIISHRKTHSKPIKLPCQACEKEKLIADKTFQSNSSGTTSALQNINPSLNGGTSHIKSSVVGENRLSLNVGNYENITDTGSKRDVEDIFGCIKERRKLGLREMKHTCETPWICDVCGNSFKKRESLSKHLRTHSGERPFKCDRCSYSAATKHTLVIHLRKHSGEKPYSCDKCSFRCSTRGYLKIHLNNHQGIKPFACHLCPYRSVDSCKLSAHKRTKHITDDKSATTSQYNLSSQHQGAESFICTLCKTAKHFTVETAFKRHISRHDRATLSCHQCNFTATVGKDLKQHQNMHNKEQTCMICNYRSVDSCKLSAHKRTKHITDDKSATTSQYNLSSQHQGAESFICTLCKTAKHFTVETAFKRHISRHDRAILSCHQCNFTATVGKDLKRHQNMHNKEQTCMICNYRTSQMAVYIKHMTTQHPNEPFEPSLLVQSQNIAANIPKPSVAIQPMVGTIIPTAVLPYAFNPMILNIPNAQTFKPLNEQGNSVVNVQNVAGNQGLVHYQQATLVPTLNFYWGPQS